MRWSATTRERMAAIAFIVLSVVVIGAVVQLVQLGGDDAPPSGGDSTARQLRAPTTTTTTPPQPIQYQVQRGDTLTSIAAQFGISVSMITAANQLADQDLLTEGQSLLIPPRPPVNLEIAPAAIRAGQPVELTLTGALPGEGVTFQIASPTGTFTGRPHTAPQDGVVSTTYTPEPTAVAGTYTVTAAGDQGTTAQSSFRVGP